MGAGEAARPPTSCPPWLSAALGGAGQLAVLGEIHEDIDNIRAAWSHAAAPGELLPLRDALDALFRFLWMRGRYAEGEQVARQALAGSAGAARADDEQVVRITLTAYAAQFAGAAGAYDECPGRREPRTLQGVGRCLRPGGRAQHCSALLRWYAGDAVLLQSGCTLLTARDPAAPHPLAPGARHELTLALLAAAQKSAPADPLTHAQAARLLAREYGKTSSAVPPTSPVRPVRQLAGEMVGAPARTQAQVASPRAD